MAFRRYLAMTEPEMHYTNQVSGSIAYLYCPFDPKNDPIPVPADADSLLVLTDEFPVDSSRFDLLGKQIMHSRFHAVLLDFQSPPDEDSRRFVKKLLQALPCPVVVSEPYAEDFHCPVFLPPLPPHMGLKEYILPWKSREIWLDISTEAEKILLTEDGVSFSTLSRFQPAHAGHWEEKLHCHYCISTSEKEALFTLWRTREDLEKLMEEAESCGAAAVVGLFQELGECI